MGALHVGISPHARRVLTGAVVAALLVSITACTSIGIDPNSQHMKLLRAGTTTHLNLVTTLTVPAGMKLLSSSVVDSCGSITVGSGADGPTHCQIARADVYSVEVPGDATANAGVVDTLFDSSGFASPTTLVGSPELAQISAGQKVIASVVTEVSGIAVRAQFMPAGMPEDLLALRLSSLPRHGGTILTSSGDSTATRIETTRASKAPYIVIIDFSEDYFSSTATPAPTPTPTPTAK
ncbi:MAG: hypothetical protein JWQ12_335 [Glaciihabitans sp.]|nr:hypothetical protein [Glaciihabitans sp.]